MSVWVLIDSTSLSKPLIYSHQKTFKNDAIPDANPLAPKMLCYAVFIKCIPRVPFHDPK